jgi:hypothetical protein
MSALTWVQAGPNLTLPDENSIVYNGDLPDTWTRASRIFGHSSIEWAGYHPEAVPVRKPTQTDCNCYTGNERVLLTGRYGRWDKNALVSDTYKEVKDALQRVQQ